MGLDSVELVMAWEEEFQIEIPDDEAARLETVGGAVAYLHKKILETHPPEPKFGMSLSEIEADLRQKHEAQIERLFPDFENLSATTSLEELFPKKSRWVDWDTFSKSLGGRVPSLRRPFWVALLIWVVSFGAAFPFLAKNAWIALFVFLIAFGLLIVVTRPLKIRFPKGIRVFRDLWSATWKAAPRKSLERIRRAGSTLEAVRIETIAVIVDQIGVTAEECTDDARFVGDLGVD